MNVDATSRQNGMRDYSSNVAAWAERQAEALRRRASNEIDWESVDEEIEVVARREHDQVKGRRIVLCVHLLIWQFLPKRRSRSWCGPIIEARTAFQAYQRTAARCGGIRPRHWAKPAATSAPQC